MERQSRIERKTKETQITLTLDLDGRGDADVKTGVPFMDHMLNLMAAHGFMNLQLSATGDTEIDDHHTVEDLGICFGNALRKALEGHRGIRRYGEATVPMDEALARAVVDISNRPFLGYRVSLKETRTGTFDVSLLKEFFQALVNHAGIALHIDLFTGDNAHHCAEAVFKAFARALDRATGVESRLEGTVPSTKGVL